MPSSPIDETNNEPLFFEQSFEEFEMNTRFNSLLLEVAINVFPNNDQRLIFINEIIKIQLTDGCMAATKYLKKYVPTR